MSGIGPKWLLLKWIEVRSEVSFRNWSQYMNQCIKELENLCEVLEITADCTMFSWPFQADSVANLRQQLLDLRLYFGA